MEYMWLLCFICHFLEKWLIWTRFWIQTIYALSSTRIIWISHWKCRELAALRIPAIIGLSTLSVNDLIFVVLCYLIAKKIECFYEFRRSVSIRRVILELWLIVLDEGSIFLDILWMLFQSYTWCSFLYRMVPIWRMGKWCQYGRSNEYESSFMV